jgi:hypothetical protein
VLGHLPGRALKNTSITNSLQNHSGVHGYLSQGKRSQYKYYYFITESHHTGVHWNRSVEAGSEAVIFPGECSRIYLKHTSSILETSDSDHTGIDRERRLIIIPGKRSHHKYYTITQASIEGGAWSSSSRGSAQEYKHYYYFSTESLRRPWSSSRGEEAQQY